MTPSPLKHINDNIYRILSDERIVGNYAYDRYNNEVERVRGLMVDAETFLPRYLVIQFGGFMSTDGKVVLVPRKIYKPEGLGRVRIFWSRESLQQGPSIQNPNHLSREEEQVVLSYFDLDPYWDVEAEAARHSTSITMPEEAESPILEESNILESGD